MRKFWNFIRNEATGERILRLEGPIDEDNFWGDSVTPKQFRDELEAEDGDVTVWINSPGGNVFCGAEIYTMLRDHKGKITVKIDAIAASAASVIAMAGERVLMSPVAMLMIHDPMTIAMGNAKDMEKAIDTLNEVKESIINAYQIKSGLSRKKISQLMEEETWMNAKKAVEFGFADEILFAQRASETEEEEKDDGKEIEAVWQPYSTRAMGQRVLNWLVPSTEESAGTDEESAEASTGQENVEPAEAGVSEQLNMFEEALPEETKAESEENGDESKENGAESKDQEEAPAEDSVPVEEEAKPEQPVIGMDGKTADGAMPFQLLMDKLECMR